jgi:hypothetical protein
MPTLNEQRNLFICYDDIDRMKMQIVQKLFYLFWRL